MEMAETRMPRECDRLDWLAIPGRAARSAYLQHGRRGIAGHGASSRTPHALAKGGD